MPVEAADVVVRTMNDFLDRIIYQDFFERSEIMKRYRIDDVYFIMRGDLNEAELLGVMVEAVRFCIQGDDM